MAGGGKGKVESRNVFLCWVCGAAGSGKTSLLRNFAGKGYRDAYIPTTKPVSVVNSVEIDGSEKYLVASVQVISKCRADNCLVDAGIWL